MLLLKQAGIKGNARGKPTSLHNKPRRRKPREGPPISYMGHPWIQVHLACKHHSKIILLPSQTPKKKKAKETRDTRSKAKQTSEGKQNHTLGCPGPEGQTD